MAMYDDKKKKQDEKDKRPYTLPNYGQPVAPAPVVAPAARIVQPPAPVVQQAGTKLGHLTLLPGSGADKAAKAAFGVANQIGQAYDANQARVNASNNAATTLRGINQAQDARFANVDQAPQGLYRNAVAQPAPLAKAAPAIPQPIFADGNNAPAAGFYRNPAGVQQRTPTQLNQADAQERAAASASPAVPVPTVGAPAAQAGGGASQVVKSRGKFGETVYTNAGDPYAAIAPPQIGSVQAQSFGNTIPNPIAAYGNQGPNVASTFGMSVNDPRINNPAAGPQPGTFRSADQMAEQYNSRESREMQTKVLSDLDSQRFALSLAAGNPGRRGREALQALGQNAQQQAAIANAAAGQAGEAVQNRNKNATQIENTQLEQGGANSRAQLDASNRLDIARIGDATDQKQIAAGLIRRPEDAQYVTDADGNYLRVNNGAATQVTGPDGKKITMPKTASNQRDYTTETDDAAFESLLKLQVDPMTNELKPGGFEAAQAQLAQRRAQGQKQAKPDFATFTARAKAQGSKMTEAQLKAAYSNL